MYHSLQHVSCSYKQQHKRYTYILTYLGILKVTADLDEETAEL